VEPIITLAKCLLQRGGLVLLKTSACCGLPIFLKANHQLESRVPEIGLLGSEGGATSSVVPTPISPERIRTSGPVGRGSCRAALSQRQTTKFLSRGCTPKPPKIPSNWISGFHSLVHPSLSLVDIGIESNMACIAQHSSNFPYREPIAE